MHRGKYVFVQEQCQCTEEIPQKYKQHCSGGPEPNVAFVNIVQGTFFVFAFHYSIGRWQHLGVWLISTVVIGVCKTLSVYLLNKKVCSHAYNIYTCNSSRLPEVPENNQSIENKRPLVLFC